MRGRIGIGFALAGATMLVAPCALAQAENVMIGGRTATMGGTGIAEGHDVAAPLLNPAGAAGVDRSALGLSATTYAWDVLEIPDYAVPTSVPPQFGQYDGRENTFTSSQFLTVPTAVAYFRHFGPADGSSHLVIGGAALIPHYINETVHSRFLVDLPTLNGYSDRVDNYTEQSRHLLVGPFAGFSPGRRVRIGVSAFASYKTRIRQFSTSQNVSVNAGNGLIQSTDTTSEDLSATSVVAVAGIQLQPIDDLWLGLSVRTPGLAVGGSNSYQLQSNGLDDEGLGVGFTGTSRRRTLDASFTDPLRVGGGVAYSHPGSFAVAADVRLAIAAGAYEKQSGTSDNRFSLSGTATRTQSVSFDSSVAVTTTVDLSVGAEVFLAEWLSLRAGYGQAHDPRQLPAPSRESWLTSKRDYQTFALGLGVQLGPVDTTVGGALQLMSGTIDVPDYFQRDVAIADTALPTRRTDLNGRTLMFILAGTITESEAKDKVGERAKEINPNLEHVLP